VAHGHSPRYIQNAVTESLQNSMPGSQNPAVSIDAERLHSVATLLFDMGASEVFVFGSAARNELRPQSDVDIAVRGLPPHGFSPRLQGG